MDIATYLFTRTYVDNKVNEVSSLSPFVYQGSVNSYSALPNSATKGDVYTTTDTGDEYVYDNSSWVKLGNDVTKSMIDAKQDIITDLGAIRSGAEAGATAVQPVEGKDLFSGDYNDLTNKPNITAINASAISALFGGEE